MAAMNSTTLWTAYYAVYFAGFAALINQTRTPGAGAAALWLPFAFPPILVWIAAMADKAEAQEPPPPPTGTVSVVTGRPTLPRHGARTISAAGMGMVTPFTNWVFPDDSPIPVRVGFAVLMLACAVFTAYVVPRMHPRADDV